MRYAILGGGGSFGLHTARYLLEQRDTQRVLSIGRAPQKQPCFLLGVGFGDFRYTYHIRHLTYDHISLMSLLDEAQPHVIINFAAQGESGTSFTESWRYFETNCAGLARLVEALRERSWLRRFLHIGTSELYGATDSPAKETAVLAPTSPYAISKAAFDQFLGLVAQRFGFPAVILRPSNCYGEGQQLHRIIPKAFLYGLTGRKLPLHGGGKAEKSFMHTHDLARAIHLLAQADAAPGSIFNVGPKEATSIYYVCCLIAGVLGMNDVFALCEVSEDRAHQDSRYWLDSSKFESLTGWRPLIAWREGLDMMRAWVSAYLDELRALPTEFIMRP